MATIKLRESGWWQAVIRRKGYPSQSQTFEKKIDAEAWARALESEMDRGFFVSRTESERTTFEQVASRYEKEILPGKRGKAQDSYRLATLVEHFGQYSLAAITSSMIADFRDQRLKALAPQTVVHDLNLISRVLKTAVMDWGIALPAGIPTAMVRKPSINNERSRRLVGDEEDRLLAAIESPGPGRKGNIWIKPIVLLAIETAARQSELLSLDWGDVDIDRRFVRLRGADGRETKNTEQFRDVPLSTKAAHVLSALAPRKNGKLVPLRRGPVFQTTASAIKQSWERAVVRARDNYERETIKIHLISLGYTEREAIAEVRKVKPLGGKRNCNPPLRETAKVVKELCHVPLLRDLHFHDLRHEATSRLADKLQLHELMKVTGHKSSKMLARYYHPRAEDLAKKLA